MSGTDESHVGQGAAAARRWAPAVVLDQATAAVVAAASRPPFLYQVGVVDGRAALVEIQCGIPDAEDLVHRQVVVPTAHGALTVHVLRRRDAASDGSAVLYVHGGGWTMGGFATHARFAQELARGTGSLVLVPDYGLAPEHPFPVAIDQLTTVLAWLASKPSEGGDVDRIALVGDCAGASMLAAIVTQRREAGPLPVCAAVLLYPFAEPPGSDPAAQDFAEGFGLRLVDVQHLVRQYGPRPATRRLAEFDPLAHAPRVPAPPILLVTADADVTRDRSEHFAARLRAAGVAVTAVRYLGTVHDFVVLDALRHTASARAATRQAVAFLTESLARLPSVGDGV